MKKFLAIFGLLLLAISGEASVTNYIWTISFTNAAGTTNGMKVTANAVDRTFTNSVVVPSTQVSTNNTPAGSANNLAVQLANFPFSSSISASLTGTTNVTLLSTNAITVTLTGNFATLSSVTNIYSTGIPVIVPGALYTQAQKTNVFSALTAEINDTSNTNRVSSVTNADYATTLLGGGTNLVVHKGFIWTNDATHSWGTHTNDAIWGTNALTGNWYYMSNAAGYFSNFATGKVITWSNATITADTFLGALSGNATTATTSSSSTNSTNFFGILSPTNYSFSSPLTPNSSATNWIPDFKDSTPGIYRTVKLTNNFNLQYVTNGAGAISYLLLPNGSDRVITVNTNWKIGSTNGWSVVTSANPGYWKMTLTNAEAGNGPRWMLLSVVGTDAASANQTNVYWQGVHSP